MPSVRSSTRSKELRNHARKVQRRSKDVSTPSRTTKSVLKCPLWQCRRYIPRDEKVTSSRKKPLQSPTTVLPCQFCSVWVGTVQSGGCSIPPAPAAGGQPGEELRAWLNEDERFLRLCFSLLSHAQAASRGRERLESVHRGCAALGCPQLLHFMNIDDPSS